MNATVAIKTTAGTTLQQVVSGDSLRSQRSNRLHFGLGREKAVQEATLQWKNGRTLLLQNPAIDKVHKVSPEE